MTHSKRSNVRQRNLSFLTAVLGSLKQTGGFSVGVFVDTAPTTQRGWHKKAEGTWKKDCANSLSLSENRAQNVRDSR